MARKLYNLTGKQIRLITVALSRNAKGGERRFKTRKVRTLAAIHSAFSALRKDEDKWVPDGDFSLYMDTKAVKLMRKCVESMTWMLADAPHIAAAIDEMKK